MKLLSILFSWRLYGMQIYNESNDVAAQTRVTREYCRGESVLFILLDER